MSRLFKPAAPALILPDRRIHRGIGDNGGPPFDTSEQSWGMVQSAIMQVLAAGGGASGFFASSYDAVNSSSDVLLSNSNRTTQANSGFLNWKTARSVASKTTGKYYVEFTGSAWNGSGMGLGNASFVITSGGTSGGINGDTTNTTGFALNGGSQFPGTGTATIGLAFDIGNKLYWPRDNTGAFTGNPAAGTGGTSWSFTGAAFVMISLYSNDSRDIVTTNFGNAAFVYTPPAGFTSGFG